MFRSAFKETVRSVGHNISIIMLGLDKPLPAGRVCLGNSFFHRFFQLPIVLECLMPHNKDGERGRNLCKKVLHFNMQLQYQG